MSLAGRGNGGGDTTPEAANDPAELLGLEGQNAGRLERADHVRTDRDVLDQEADVARAAATASSREWTPSARKRRRMWFLTVSVLR